MEYIHAADAQQFIKDHLQLYDDQKNTIWATDWNTSWAAKTLLMLSGPKAYDGLGCGGAVFSRLILVVTKAVPSLFTRMSYCSDSRMYQSSLAATPDWIDVCTMLLLGPTRAPDAPNLMMLFSLLVVES